VHNVYYEAWRAFSFDVKHDKKDEGEIIADDIEFFWS
jgi:hypothetical protein